MKVYIQQKENECGLYIIKSLYEYYHNLKKDINNLREQVSISKKGISVYDLLSLAKENYIDLTPFQAKAKDVISNKNEYFIVGFKNIKYHHYVIIEIKKDYVSVFDPAAGKYKLLFEEFEKLYNQLVITIKPKKLLVKKTEKAKMKMISFIFNNMRIIFMSLILIFVIIIISFLSTFFMKIVFDNIIPSQALNLLGLISILFISITIVRIFITYLKNLFIQKINLKIEIILYKKYVNKLAKAKFNNLQKFSKSDLLRRMTLIETSSMFLSSSIFILVEESITTLVAMSILIYINPQFFAIVLATSMIMILISILFHFLIHPFYKSIFKKAIENFSYQNIRVYEINNLKEVVYKSFSDDHLLSPFYSLKSQEYKLWKIISWKNILDGLINGIIPIIITYIYVKQMFTSNNKPGNMLLFLTTINFFNAGLQNLTDYFLKLKQNLINWKYISTILKLKDEKNNSNGIILEKIDSLTLIDINFKYQNPILDIKKLKFYSSIKICAGNGTGKSTLLKLIALRFIPDFPYKINKIDYSFYNLDRIREKIFYLENNSFLPSSKIFAFITLNDVDLIATFNKNLQKYNLNNFLVKNGIKLEKFFKEGGANLSSGQKQIIALMRLFTRKYQLIVLDEALENISYSNLIFLRKNICNYQKDAIFVEVSHTKRFIKNGQEIQLEKINNIKI